MAGLVAAARLRQLGRTAVVLEKGARAGGSMLLSSGVVWRHRELGAFRDECPTGDRALQELVWERLDDALDWVESLDAPVTARETGNALTLGRRFDTRGLTDTLVAAAAGVAFETPLGDPEGEVVLATGGFGVRFAADRGLALRAAPWSEGDGIAFALARGAALTEGQDEFYGRAMPAPPAEWGEADFVRAAQLYGRWAAAVDDDGRPVFQGRPAWHENDLVQALARRPGGVGWYHVAEAELAARVRERTVADMVAEAERLGGEVERDDHGVRVKVQSAVTHTIGGLRVDEDARVVGADGLWAAGADAGGIFTGGYASGLAAALVFGRRAAESVDRITRR
jgi:FAD binding domain